MSTTTHAAFIENTINITIFGAEKLLFPRALIQCIGPDKKSVLNFQYLLIHSLKHLFWCTKESSPGDGSFEYLQHMFRLSNKKINF